MLVLKDPEKVLPVEILKYEAHIVRIGKRLVQGDNKLGGRMRIFSKQLQQILFLLDMLNAFFIVERKLRDSFKRSQLVAHNNKVYRAKLAFPNVNAWVLVNKLFPCFRRLRVQFL